MVSCGDSNGFFSRLNGAFRVIFIKLERKTGTFNVSVFLLQIYRRKVDRNMNKKLELDYYYGMEAEQFSFIRVPKILMKDDRFRQLSSDAKLLYGLMLDRMALSKKNEWLDESNRVYIIYTVESVIEDLGCSKPTAIKIMKELDSENGLGLIEKVRRGLGKPDLIYIKNFATYNSKRKKENPAEVKNFDLQNTEELTSEDKELKLQGVKKIVTNETNNNNTEWNNHLSFNLSTPNEERFDTEIYINLIQSHIDYHRHILYDKREDKQMFEELYQLICEVVCVQRKYIKIAGENYPYELVKDKFLKLNDQHLLYVMDRMRNTTSRIENIKAYMLTALYNAPGTMHHYYQQRVLNDLYGEENTT